MSTSAKVNLSYDQFCESWLEANHLDTLSGDEKRRETTLALFSHWLGEDLNQDDFHWLENGAGAGVDGFYFLTDEDENDAEDDENIGANIGLTAYIVRFLSPDETEGAVLREATKLRSTLSNPSQSNLGEELRPLLDFWQGLQTPNRVEVIFAALHPLPPKEIQDLDVAATTLSTHLEVKVSTVSLYQLYVRENEDLSVQVPLKMHVPDVENGAQLVIGAVALPDLFEFLQAYDQARGDLDPLYEKNVRLFLGRTGKTNKGISATLRSEPENFGLYNNGLTLVAREIEPQGNGVFLLTDPSVVNGCQTTRTVWATLSEALRLPSTEQHDAWRDWRSRLEKGLVVAKIVRVAPGEGGAEMLANITRFTNSQNAVKDKDFIALDADFKRWKREMAHEGVFLEILRGEGSAQLARQKKRDFHGTKYRDFAKAFELLKVYGAGWLDEPGPAWNKNAAFVPPRGAIFKRIIHDDHFGGDDLLAALHLQQAAEKQLFGKRGKNVPEARKLTRFLFYRTAIELLRQILRRNNLPATPKDCTRAILALHQSFLEWEEFIDLATSTVDDYMNPNNVFHLQKEPVYNGNLNGIFKLERFARDQNDFPQLWQWWTFRVLTFENEGGVHSPAKRITALLHKALA